MGPIRNLFPMHMDIEANNNNTNNTNTNTNTNNTTTSDMENINEIGEIDAITYADFSELNILDALLY